MTYDEWRAEAERRFGSDAMQWRFRCPACDHIASVQDWIDAGASEGEVAFSCIGRRKPSARSAFAETGAGPCDYAGGGLIRLNPITVEFNGRNRTVFAFAD